MGGGDGTLIDTGDNGLNRLFDCGDIEDNDEGEGEDRRRRQHRQINRLPFLGPGGVLIMYTWSSMRTKKESTSSSSVSEPEESTSEDTWIFEQTSDLKSSLSSTSLVAIT